MESEQLAPGRKTDLSISLGKANLLSLFFVIPPVLLFGLLFWLDWGPGAFKRGFETSGRVTFFLVSCLVAILLHELIHAIAWVLAGKKPVTSIRFGFSLKTLTPYTHIREPLEINAYRLGSVMPAAVLGVIPAVIGLLIGQSAVMWFGVVFIAAAGGDFLVLWLIRNVPAGTLVEDHATRAGCFILESNDEHPNGNALWGRDPHKPEQGNRIAWVVAADMGYGHLRAVYPLRDIAEGGIISVGEDDATTPSERKLWRRLVRIYERFSRAWSIPVVGRIIFGILDGLLRIPTLYPLRDLSHSTFQVNLLRSLIGKGLCGGMLERIREKHLPLVTSFYAPAIAADLKGIEKVYCIICDADLNRVWVAREPWESRIEYFAPCGRAVQRLKAYGVPDDRIFLTGFPLPSELLGGREMSILKADLAQRLFYLDPKRRFWSRFGINVEYFLGKEYCTFRADRTLTITYAVGGAGALKEVGVKIARSLKVKLLAGEVRLNLAAGTKEPVRQFFEQTKQEIPTDNIRVIYAGTAEAYFAKFNETLRTTDILWTKPSELSFYSALGIPIIMTPAIGSQEKFNRRWLQDIQAGVRQEHPEYTDQWLFDLLKSGRLAEAAWAGFLKARKLGTYKIQEVLTTGQLAHESSPIMR